MSQTETINLKNSGNYNNIGHSNTYQNFDGSGGNGRGFERAPSDGENVTEPSDITTISIRFPQWARYIPLPKSLIQSKEYVMVENILRNTFLSFPSNRFIMLQSTLGSEFPLVALSDYTTASGEKFTLIEGEIKTDYHHSNRTTASRAEEPTGQSNLYLSSTVNNKDVNQQQPYKRRYDFQEDQVRPRLVPLERYTADHSYGTIPYRAENRNDSRMRSMHYSASIFDEAARKVAHDTCPTPNKTPLMPSFLRGHPHRWAADPKRRRTDDGQVIFRQASAKAGERCVEFKIPLGVFKGNNRVVADVGQATKVVFGRDCDFSFSWLFDALCAQYGIAENEKRKWCIVSPKGHILCQQEENDNFQNWKDRIRNKNTFYFALRPGAEETEADYETASEHSPGRRDSWNYEPVFERTVLMPRVSSASTMSHFNVGVSHGHSPPLSPVRTESVMSKSLGTRAQLQISIQDNETAKESGPVVVQKDSVHSCPVQNTSRRPGADYPDLVNATRELECCICMLYMKEPLLCPVNDHVMAGRPCIEELIRRAGVKGKFECPQCRADIPTDTELSVDERINARTQKIMKNFRSDELFCKSGTFVLDHVDEDDDDEYQDMIISSDVEADQGVLD